MRRPAVFQRSVRTLGFTVTELVIVVSVIAILAAIVMVSYENVQNNSRDAAVQSDLRNMGDRMEEFRLGSTGQYPTATQADLEGLVKVAKDAYVKDTASGAMSYCRNNTDFTILGRSASKKAFVFSSKDGLKEVTFSGNLNDQCALGGIASTDPGFSRIWLLKGTANPEGYGWQPWID